MMKEVFQISSLGYCQFGKILQRILRPKDIAFISLGDMFRSFSPNPINDSVKSGSRSLRRSDDGELGTRLSEGH